KSFEMDEKELNAFNSTANGKAVRGVKHRVEFKTLTHISKSTDLHRVTLNEISRAVITFENGETKEFIRFREVGTYKRQERVETQRAKAIVLGYDKLGYEEINISAQWSGNLLRGDTEGKDNQAYEEYTDFVKKDLAKKLALKSADMVRSMPVEMKDATTSLKFKSTTASMVQGSNRRQSMNNYHNPAELYHNLKHRKKGETSAQAMADTRVHRSFHDYIVETEAVFVNINPIKDASGKVITLSNPESKLRAILRVEVVPQTETGRDGQETVDTKWFFDKDRTVTFGESIEKGFFQNVFPDLSAEEITDFTESMPESWKTIKMKLPEQSFDDNARRARYTRNTNTIEWNPESNVFNNKANAVSTLFHELIHDSFSSLSPELQAQALDFAKQVKAKIKTAVDSKTLSEADTNYLNDWLNIIDAAPNGLEEIFTYGLTDRIFRNILNSISAEGIDTSGFIENQKDSLWERILNFVFKLLGFNTSTKGFLTERIESVFVSVMNSNSNPLDKSNGNREYSDKSEDDKKYSIDISEEGFKADRALRQERILEEFNNDLLRYKEGTMKTNETFQLGYPSGILKHFLPDLPIIMRQRVVTKGIIKKHEVDIEALRNMPNIISNPVFLFKRHGNAIGLLTTMTDKNGKNVFVVIELQKTVQEGNSFLEVNDILSFHGRELENIVLPINENNTLQYADKEQGLNYLTSALRNFEQARDNKNPESTAKIQQEIETAIKTIESFENPVFEKEKSAGLTTDGRTDPHVPIADFAAKIEQLIETAKSASETTENQSSSVLETEDFVDKLDDDISYDTEIRYSESAQAQQYFYNNPDRLRLTLSAFERPEFKVYRGKTIRYNEIKGLLNLSGIKVIEKELINNVISERYSDVKQIPYDEMEITVRASIIPLERIETKIYSQTGSDIIAKNADKYYTLILNMPNVEHGEQGHFFTSFYGRNTGLYGHIRLWQDSDNTYIAEFQSDLFQKYNAKKKLMEKKWETGSLTKSQYEKLKTFLLYSRLHSVETVLNDANYEIKQDIDSYFRLYKNNTAITQKVISDIEEEVEYKDKIELLSNILLNHEAINFSDTDIFKNLETILAEYNKSISETKLQLNEKIEKSMNPAEKQFIASQKIFERRLVHEAVEEARRNKSTSVRFPTPYTLAAIEGYIDPVVGASYTIISAEDSRILQTGDVIRSNGENYIIIEDNRPTNVSELGEKPFYHVIAVPEGKTMKLSRSLVYDKMVSDKSRSNSVEEVTKGINKYSNKIPSNIISDLALKYEQKRNTLSLFERALVELVDMDFDISREVYTSGFINLYNKGRFFRSVSYEERLIDIINDYSYENFLYLNSNYILVDEDFILWDDTVQPKIFSQIGYGISKELFKTFYLSESEKRVLEKYFELESQIKKDFGENNVKTVQDENNFDWIELDLTKEEVRNKPV
ncbi:MAG: hypothetical protein LBG80_12550, partial [Bacteroidales bacterium]|nr:hypothetical protein [Bacteroidales bacterium]